MGRYYSGDINGKFWFGVQASNAADRFGSIGHEPSYIEYHFSDHDLHEVEAEIKRIEDTLGDKITVIENFFKSLRDSGRFGYKDNDLQELGINDDDLSEYADLRLGKQIRDCIKEQGYCEFTAEL
jgi:hypothetical protein